DLDFIVADFAGLDLKDLDIGEFLTSLLNLARKNDVELPSVVTMFARGMVTLEGLLTEYMPNVNMIQIIQTHIKNEKSTYARMREMSRDFAASSYRAAKGSLEAAEYLGLASRTRGQLTVNTQIMRSDKALRQLGGIIDRMSMAIVIAGLFIGSSVVYYARIEPVVFGIPVIGFMGYVSALVLALMLGRNIWLNSHGGKR
ncbi:MAG: AarF/ABC1/UbiB kinase family protein, partial [Collinsella sp.]